VYGGELLKRLEELNWRMLKTGDVPDSKKARDKESRKAS
jgi:hypothetical protein